MQAIIDIILRSGETGVNLALYVLLPVMVVMMAIMKALEDRGVLKQVAIIMSPLLALFGLPGLGVFAILQILLVSFAAPITTLKIMEKDYNISEKQIAATLAAILVMSQANATFPLAMVGLNIPVVILTSVVGGLLAGVIAYRLADTSEDACIVGNESAITVEGSNEKERLPKEKTSLIQVLFKGGGEGMQVVLNSLPPLILAVFLVNIFRSTGVIDLIEKVLSPALVRVGVPGTAILPIVTKYLAGGTAMMAITLDLVKEGALSVVELNRIAGFATNPLDPVGVALLVSAGPRVASITKPAMKGALVGIALRAVLHLIIF